jgi:hypothetical protein
MRAKRIGCERVASRRCETLQHGEASGGDGRHTPGFAGATRRRCGLRWARESAVVAGAFEEDSCRKFVFVGAISPNLRFKKVHIMSRSVAGGGGGAAAAAAAAVAGGGVVGVTAVAGGGGFPEPQSASADVAAPTHEYFYALPQDSDMHWHVVHQQRLDSDDNAASRVREAVLAEFTGIPADAVEVAAIDVDMFNNAFKFKDGGKEQICRSKKFSGHEWRLENKRFLVRVKSLHSHHILRRLASLNPSDQPLRVQNVLQLATQLVIHGDRRSQYYQTQSPYGKDFERYETNSWPKKEITAVRANSGDIPLSLCSPLVFAVQASLAHAPSSPVNLSALGTAFLDIIKVTIAPAGLLLASRHASSYRPFSPAFTARYMERAHHLDQLLLPQFHALSHAKLLRPLPRTQQRTSSVWHQHHGAAAQTALAHSTFIPPPLPGASSGTSEQRLVLHWLRHAAQNRAVRDASCTGREDASLFRKIYAVFKPQPQGGMANRNTEKGCRGDGGRASS